MRNAVDLDGTDVLQPAGSLSEQGEGVVDEAAVKPPQRRVVWEGDVFSSPGQQVGGDLCRMFNMKHQVF